MKTIHKSKSVHSSSQIKMMGCEEKVKEICLAKFHWNANVPKKKGININFNLNVRNKSMNNMYLYREILSKSKIYYPNNEVSTINSFLAGTYNKQNVKMLH
jgi:hypothetical protein